MRRIVLFGSLLASTALAGPVLAQDIAPVSTSSSTVSEVTVKGQSKSHDGVTRTDLGGGLMVHETAPRVRQTVTRDFIAKQPPSANPEQLLVLQPSANVTLGDPFGLSVGRMTVRGLDIGEIGWLFEGMPFNNGAVYPNEILDSENLSTISLTPGSVDFDVPTFGAAAGLVEMHFRDPAMRPGGFINLSAGSDRYNSEFLRLDSGEIGNTGVRGFISASITRADAWHGPGVDQRHHVDFKAIKEFGNGSESALSVAWNHQLFMLDRWPTLAQWQAHGRSWTYDRRFTAGDTNYWKFHQSAFDNVAVSAPNRIKLIPNLDLAVTPYFFHGGGTSPGAAQLTETGVYSGPTHISFLPLPVDSGTGTAADSAVLYTPTIYNQFRTGVNAALNYHLGGHTLTAGYWYEYDYATTMGVLDAVNSAGAPSSVWASTGLIHLSNGQLYRSSYTKTIAEVNGFYVGDRASLLDDRLEIDGGFKQVTFAQQGYNLIPGETYRRNAYYSIPLPTLAARYNINAHNSIYANAGTNFLTPQSSQLFDVYSMTTGKMTQQGGVKQKAEYSIVEEIGYRYDGDIFSGSVSIFNYNFRNRQVSTSVIQNGVSVSEYVNAGNQTSRGVDVELGLKPWHHFRPFVSGEYLHATNDSNMTAPNGDLLPTAGKVAVRSPAWMGSLGLDYDNGSFFGNIDAHYTGPQFSTFMNDQRIPGYATANMTIGYRMGAVGWAKTPVVQLNLVNVTDTKYLGGVYTVQYNAKAARATNGDTIAASGQPTYLAGAGFAAIVSVSASF
ncbi:MAG: TonB-dependent receptor [Caulobacteraceae bacterium]|nr:TonB-dependent receptor [Caulobacteraceae bacterium]